MPDNPLEQMRALLGEATADGSVYMAVEVEAVEAFLEVAEQTSYLLYEIQRGSKDLIRTQASIVEEALTSLYERLSVDAR